MRSESTGGEPPRRRGLARLLWIFVAWFLENLYTRWAWGYDLVASLTSMGQWWRWQEAAMPALPAGRLLELGFGTGHFIEKLTQRGHAVIGLDLSRQMTQLARRRLLQAELPVSLIQGSATDLPFADNSFRGILATFPSDYFYKQETFTEIWRALEPGGKVIVIPFAMITGRSLWDRAARLLYQLTGQSPTRLDTTWLGNLEIPGFEIHYQMVLQERAKVLRVTLEKVPTDKPTGSN